MVPAPKFSPQQQEEKILTAAAQCIAETSLMDFTMSSIAKRAGLSMGSIYKHIQTKEDADSDNKCNFLERRPADRVRLFSRQRKLHNELPSADRK
jgi:AcrR family transcriptional regulator